MRKSFLLIAGLVLSIGLVACNANEQPIQVSSNANEETSSADASLPESSSIDDICDEFIRHISNSEIEGSKDILYVSPVYDCSQCSAHCCRRPGPVRRKFLIRR